VDAISDSQVRRAAQKVGWKACKSRDKYHHNNQLGYQLVDPYKNEVKEGVRFELTGQDVLDICNRVANGTY